MSLPTTPERFAQDFLRLLRAGPVEDGSTHPAETLVEQALHTQCDAAAWIQRLFLRHHTHPAIATALLKCIGRLPCALVEPWGQSLATIGLASASLDIREAAVTALELWGDTLSLDILNTHTEDTPWLARYITRIIRELSYRGATP